MAVKASNEVTVIDQTDAKDLVTWYQLSTSAIKPNKPTTTSASATPSGWTKAEPSYDPSQGTKYLYTCQQLVWGDDTCSWGDVQLSSSYEAAKAAVNAAAAANSAANEAYEKITSRGEQLIVNGNGFMGDNTNFSQLTFDGYQANGSPGSFTKASNITDTIFSDSFFPVDASKEYICEFDVKAGSTNGAAMYAMLVFYDVDKRPIKVQMVSYFDGSTTTLAQELKNGDTKVYLTNASGFANTSAAHERSLIIWDYTNSFGYTYPAETYSRNYYACVYSSDSAVDKTNNVISLASAWTGGTHAAGTPISQNRSSNVYSYFWYITNKALFPTEWTHVTGTYSGTRNTGGPNQTGKFWPGTAYCKIGWLWNYQANTTTNIQDPIWVTNISVKENVATVQALEAVEASASYRDQTIYRSAASGTTSMSKNTTWVTDVTGGQNKWTTRRPEYSQSYPVLFVAVQHQTITQSSGTSCTCTTPAIDNTTTVIDGGNIITGTVTANKLNASDINASKSLTVGAMTDAAAATILNSNVVVGGRNLLQKSAASAENLPLVGGNGATFVTEDGHPCYKASGGSTVGMFYGNGSGNALAPTLEANTTYTYSSWIKVTTTASGVTSVAHTFTSLGHHQVYNANSTASDKAHEEIASKRVYTPSAVSIGEWTYITEQFTTNNLPGSRFGKYVKHALRSDYTVYVRDMKLEKGNKATDWSPAPEDVDADISKAAQTATNYVTEINGDGVWVTPSNAKPVNGAAASTTSGWHISDAIELFRSGASMFKVWLDNAATKVRIGPEDSGNVLIDDDSIDIRNGIDENDVPVTLASFAANLIELGKNSTSAIIEFCGGMARIRYETAGAFFESANGHTWLRLREDTGEKYVTIGAAENNSGHVAFVQLDADTSQSRITIAANEASLTDSGASGMLRPIGIYSASITTPANDGADVTVQFSSQTGDSYVPTDASYAVILTPEGAPNGFTHIVYTVTNKTRSGFTIHSYNDYSQSITQTLNVMVVHY